MAYNEEALPSTMFRLLRRGSTNQKYSRPQTKTFANMFYALQHLKALKDDGAEESQMWIGDVTWRKATEEEIEKMRKDISG